jgi:hypothetical protein
LDSNKLHHHFFRRTPVAPNKAANTVKGISPLTPNWRQEGEERFDKNQTATD